MICGGGIDPMIEIMAMAGQTLEAAGAGIMMRQSLLDIGTYLTSCGEQLGMLSDSILILADTTSTTNNNGAISSQRMAYASEKMIEAGTELKLVGGNGTKTKPKGKGWLKG